MESVHALAGVMDDMNAAKGVMVTTSWVGKASRDFAARNGNRIQIIEGRELNREKRRGVRGQSFSAEAVRARPCVTSPPAPSARTHR